MSNENNNGRTEVATLSVSDILGALAAGDTVEELLADLPYITREDIHACLACGACAVDHAVVQAA